MDKPATVKDIAQRMGISLSTVNKALTGKPGISEQRRQEVLAVAAELGYRVNHVAQTLSRKPMTIGVILPTLWPQYHAALERGICMEAQSLAQQNVDIRRIPVSCSEEISHAFAELRQARVSAILYCPSLLALPEDCLPCFRSGDIPVFLAGDQCPEANGICTVRVDGSLSGRMAADFLRFLLSPGEQAVMFTGSRSLPSHEEKAAAFLARAETLGLLPSVQETGDDPARVSSLLRSLLDRSPVVRGIYIATATVRPVLEIVQSLPAEVRPHILATDLYDDVQTGMADRIVDATLFQNQTLMGRLAVRTAYRYVIAHTSYAPVPEKTAKEILVFPQLMLPSQVETALPDDGSSHRICY